MIGRYGPKQGSRSLSLAVIWVVTWCGPSLKGSRAIFVLCDSKSEGQEKIGNTILESRSQMLQATRRNQDPVQFTGR